VRTSSLCRARTRLTVVEEPTVGQSWPSATALLAAFCPMIDTAAAEPILPGVNLKAHLLQKRRLISKIKLPGRGSSCRTDQGPISPKGLRQKVWLV